jgi:hypothetical protein
VQYKCKTRYNRDNINTKVSICVKLVKDTRVHDDSSLLDTITLIYNLLYTKRYLSYYDSLIVTGSSLTSNALLSESLGNGLNLF